MKKNNRIINIVSIGLLFVLVVWPGIVLAGTGIISYQGRLTDPNGTPVTGLREMTFKIFISPSGGSALWEEIQTIAVNDGAYNVYLGKVTTIPINIFQQNDLYLEVSIMNTDSGESTPLFPRVELTSVPYAMRALNADTTDNVDDADADPGNEIQTLGTIGNNITLSKGGGSITAPYSTNADMVDGKHAHELGTGDGYSLDAADGSPVDAVYVDSNGNVGIGTTTPQSKLHVTGRIVANEISAGVDGIRSGGDIIWGGIARLTFEYPYHEIAWGDGTGWFFSFVRKSDGEHLVDIRDNGNVGIGTTNPTRSLDVRGNVIANDYEYHSDSRLKKNIANIDDALDKVLALRGVEFEWRNDGFPGKNFAEGKDLGLIGQEVEKVLPEVVSTDGEGYKSISYMKMIPLLIESVKELKNQNEELKKRIETLEQQKI